MSKVYMMVTITNRNKRKDFQTFFKEYGLPVFLETIGRGTAQSEVLDYFGLEESEKLLFLAIVTGETWKKLRRGLITTMYRGQGYRSLCRLAAWAEERHCSFL